MWRNYFVLMFKMLRKRRKMFVVGVTFSWRYYSVHVCVYVSGQNVCWSVHTYVWVKPGYEISQTRRLAWKTVSETFYGWVFFFFRSSLRPPTNSLVYIYKYRVDVKCPRFCFLDFSLGAKSWGRRRRGVIDFIPFSKLKFHRNSLFTESNFYSYYVSTGKKRT